MVKYDVKFFSYVAESMVYLWDVLYCAKERVHILFLYQVSTKVNLHPKTYKNIQLRLSREQFKIRSKLNLVGFFC